MKDLAGDILEMRNISKEFFGIKALNNVNFSVRGNEIHGIVGENGAGKSTLMNILSGTYPYGQYSGQVLFKGEECKFSSIHSSEKQGIVIIHQELALNPYMSIAENIYLGYERKKHGIIDWNETNRLAAHFMEMVSLHEDPKTLVKDIGVGKQQLVEIAKALAKDVKLLILDEPTASLNDEDSMHLLNLLKELKQKGIVSILISHKLHEINYVADRITIIRDGCTIETLDKATDEITEGRIIHGMVGREMSERFPKRNSVIGNVIFEAEHFSAYHPTFQDKKIVNDVSIHVSKGEVVGMYGLMGAGRTEFVMALFGKSYGHKITGTVKRNGKVVNVSTPRAAIRNGIALITEDRKGNGLNLIGNIKSNITMAALQKVSRGVVIDKNREDVAAEEYRTKLNIKCASLDQRTESLSGGNQQKVVLAKWIFTSPRGSDSGRADARRGCWRQVRDLFHHQQARGGRSRRRRHLVGSDGDHRRVRSRLRDA